MPKKEGLVHIYFGDGRGKTTSAIGLGLRACGQGMRVCIVQFFKGGLESGEIKLLNKLRGRVKIYRFGQVHPIFLKCKGRLPREELKESLKSSFNFTRKILSSQKYDMVILDEILNAVSENFLDVKKLKELINARNPYTEVVLTGRRCPKIILKEASYITHMRCIKHPYQKGKKARRGIEF